MQTNKSLDAAPLNHCTTLKNPLTFFAPPAIPPFRGGDIRGLVQRETTSFAPPAPPCTTHLKTGGAVLKLTRWVLPISCLSVFAGALISIGVIADILPAGMGRAAGLLLVGGLLLAPITLVREL